MMVLLIGGCFLLAGCGQPSAPPSPSTEQSKPSPRSEDEPAAVKEEQVGVPTVVEAEEHLPEPKPAELAEPTGETPAAEESRGARDFEAQDMIAMSVADVKTNGTFGFPQKKAKVLCDSIELKFSVWSNAEYLCAQAVLWNDGDDSLGAASRGRQIGDWSALMLDVDADGQRTPNVDKTYNLNPWPHLPGLRYQIVLSARGWTGLKGDSQGRGSIQYVQTDSGKRIRIDTYLVPLSEIATKPSDKIRLCYWGSSQKPKLTVNSARYEHSGPTSYSYQIPHGEYHEIVLGDGGEIQIEKIPRGRPAHAPAGLAVTTGSASTAPSSRPRPVPTGGVDELLEYMRDLREHRPDIGAVEPEWVRLALKTAAERILRLEKDEWSEAYQTALRVLLEDRIRTIGPASPERRRETVDFVKTFLTAKLARRLERQDVDLAIALAKALEDAGDRELAAEAYGAFAELTGKSDEEALLDAARMMEKAARRLQAPGKD